MVMRFFHRNCSFPFSVSLFLAGCFCFRFQQSAQSVCMNGVRGQWASKSNESDRAAAQHNWRNPDTEPLSLNARSILFCWLLLFRTKSRDTATKATDWASERAQKCTIWRSNKRAKTHSQHNAVIVLLFLVLSMCRRFWHIFHLDFPQCWWQLSTHNVGLLRFRFNAHSMRSISHCLQH